VRDAFARVKTVPCDECSRAIRWWHRRVWLVDNERCVHLHCWKGQLSFKGFVADHIRSVQVVTDENSALSRNRSPENEYLKARAEHPLTDIDKKTLQPDIPYTVRLQLAPIHCWKCGKQIKVARGYVYGDPDIPEEQMFISLRRVTDTRQLIALITDLRKRDETITPVGFNYSKAAGEQYFSAHCPYCALICDAFYMTNASFFSEQALCDFPECECCYSPDVHCQGCEYHEARLRLGTDEIEKISNWLRATR
jgi:hypothetical protein